MAKNAPQFKVEMHQKEQKWLKMTKNWQKWPKNGKNCIKKWFSKSIFFSRLRRDVPPPAGEGLYKKSASPPHSHTPYFFGGWVRVLRSKKVKKWSKNGPKMAQKWSKWPKLPQNRRNNWRGSPRKSQQILTRDNTCSRLARRRHFWPAAPSFVLDLSSK